MIWGPRQGSVRELAPLSGDNVGLALWINDNGQAVGTSGTCDNTVPPPFAKGPHAVLWQPDGSAVDLGNLGGTVSPTALGLGTIALSINNQGLVVGTSALAGNKSNHAFLWTKQKGIKDLGVLDGDVNSVAFGINDRAKSPACPLAQWANDGSERPCAGGLSSIPAAAFFNQCRG